MLKKFYRSGTKGILPEAVKHARGADADDVSVGFSTVDLYWMANEHQKLAVRRNAASGNRIRTNLAQRTEPWLPRIEPARAERGIYAIPPTPPPVTSSRRSSRGGAEAERDLSRTRNRDRTGTSSPPNSGLPLLPDRGDIASDRAFYLGYTTRNVRSGLPNISAELLGRHSCEVLGQQACHACMAENFKLRQSQSTASNGLTATVIAKATRLQKLFRNLSVRQIQDKLTQGDIASDSFLATRARHEAARNDLSRPTSSYGIGPVASSLHENADQPTDRRTVFFENLRDLREKIRYGIIPNAVVKDDSAGGTAPSFGATYKLVDKIAITSESFRNIYYSPPLLTVDQQNVQSAFFAGCDAEYDLPPSLPGS